MQRRLFTLALAAQVLLAPQAQASSPATPAAAIPQAALAYRADLIRSARAVWGINAPIATFAAQIHQESAWQSAAVSRVGAAGLAQFMPATAKWIAGLYPELQLNQPFNPAWAIRALVTYDHWLHQRVSAANPCERMAFVLSSYNGGLGWIARDKALAAQQGLNPALWFSHVERVNAGRSQANWRENRDYPRRILQRHERTYRIWGQGVCP